MYLIRNVKLLGGVIEFADGVRVLFYSFGQQGDPRLWNGSKVGGLARAGGGAGLGRGHGAVHRRAARRRATGTATVAASRTGPGAGVPGSCAPASTRRPHEQPRAGEERPRQAGARPLDGKAGGDHEVARHRPVEMAGLHVLEPARGVGRAEGRGRRPPRAAPATSRRSRGRRAAPSRRALRAGRRRWTDVRCRPPSRRAGRRPRGPRTGRGREWDPWTGTSLSKPRHSP